MGFLAPTFDSLYCGIWRTEEMVFNQQELWGKNRKDKTRGGRADWRRGNTSTPWWAEESWWSNDFMGRKRRWALALSCSISILSFYMRQLHSFSQFSFSFKSIRSPVLLANYTTVALTHPSCLNCNEKLHSDTIVFHHPRKVKNGPHKYKSDFSWVSPLFLKSSASPWNSFLE